MSRLGAGAAVPNCTFSQALLGHAVQGAQTEQQAGRQPGTLTDAVADAHILAQPRQAKAAVQLKQEGVAALVAGVKLGRQQAAKCGQVAGVQGQE